MNDVSSLSGGLILVLGLIALIELGLMVFALVVLVRTPSERVKIGGRKWVWALIIIFFNLIGPIVFLAAGRKPAVAAEPVAAAPAASRATAAADALYGAPAPAATAAPAVPAAPPVPPAAPAPSVPAPAPAPADPAAVEQAAEQDAATPEALADDPEIGSDGTGAGELP